MNYVLPLLVILIYFPIYVFAFFSKGFRVKFMMVHSRRVGDVLVEALVGVIYFVIILYTFFLDFSIGVFLILGALVYVVSLFVTYFGYFAFGRVGENELAKSFPYNFSRNPTYFFGLLGILGVGLISGSFVILVLVVLQFVLTHKIILLEEKYCRKRYGDKFENYKRRVRRYV